MKYMVHSWGIRMPNDWQSGQIIELSDSEVIAFAQKYSIMVKKPISPRVGSFIILSKFDLFLFFDELHHRFEQR